MIVFQEYKNNSTTPIEAKYVFPLDDMAAGVCVVKLFFLVFVISTVWNISPLISTEEVERWQEAQETKGVSPPPSVPRAIVLFPLLSLWTASLHGQGNTKEI